MSLRRSYGGRRMARYATNSDLQGRLAEARFDLNPDPPTYRPSPHEAAEAAFEALPQAEKDQLTGWVVSNLTKAIPRAPWDGSQKTGLLGSATLASEAAQDLGQSVTAAQIAGAALALEFETVTSGPSASDLKIASVWKTS